MANFVLIHGAWGGSWAWDRLAEELFTAGHPVLPVNLTGLGKWKDKLHPGITLTDHVDDACAQIEAAGFDSFVLVGHSYGGMVITGVATRLGARIPAICYVDAFVPKDGESLWDITGQYEHDWYIDTQKFTPGLVAPIAGEELLENPLFGRHPLLTLTEAVRFTGEEAKIARRSYIFANAWEPTPFRRFFNELRDDPAWEVHQSESSHAVMADQPDQLRAILLDLAG